MKSFNDISRQPKWVQSLIYRKDNRIAVLEKELERLGQAHELLFQKEWFVLGTQSQESYKLFMLNRDCAQPICSIGKGDYLLVGRDKK